ncbi:MAG: CvpA family protein [Candidatus Kerfeldbacteria bacterium]|nr:CvpA family protein [Candidatus Kerfeldbacteria bacterium]
MINIALVIVLALSALSGFRKGLIYAVGGILGFIVATFLASRWYEGLGETFGGSIASEIISFIVLYVLISGVIMWGVGLINSTFNLIAIIPGMKLLNRLLGTVVGVLEGALFIGIVVLAVRHITGNTDFVADSEVVQWCVKIARLLVPLLPAEMKNLSPVFNV